MIIKNSTVWDTANLRKLFYKCVREVEKIESPEYKFTNRKRRFILEIMNTEGGSRGRATVNGHWIMIKIPKAWRTETEISEDHKAELVRLIVHEYYHTIGYRYHDRCNYKRDFTKNWESSWSKDYPIKQKETKKEVKQDLRQKRYKQAIVNLKQATTRKKRSETLYKKWRDKVAYYERQFSKS